MGEYKPYSDVLPRYSRESRTWQPRRASSPKSLPRRKRAPPPPEADAAPTSTGTGYSNNCCSSGNNARRDAHEYARWPRCPPRRTVGPLFDGRLRPAVPGLQARSPEARRDARSRSQAAEGAEAAAALTWQKRRRHLPFEFAT